MRVLDEEIVNRPAIARGVNAGIDNAPTSQMNAARNPVKQAGVIGRNDSDKGCAAILVIFALHRKRLILLSRGMELAQISRDNILWLSDPIGLAHLFAMQRH